MKKKLTPLPKLLKKTEEAVNAAIRRRDSKNGFFTCISCRQVLSIEKMNAGHFVPVSKSNYLRFHPLNIWGECRHDNLFNHFHLVPYHINLTNRIGAEKVNRLISMKNTVKHWSRSELEHIIELANQDEFEAIIFNYYHDYILV